MHLEKFINSKTGKIISSVILGIGLATLFHSACKGKNCRLYYAPPLKETEDKICCSTAGAILHPQPAAWANEVSGYEA